MRSFYGKTTYVSLPAPLFPLPPPLPRCASHNKPEIGAADTYNGNASAPVEIQFESNTLDVRSRSVDEAIAELDERLAGAGPRSVLFVVHGVGKGQLRAAIRSFLDKHPEVQTWKDDSNSAGGCTVVVMR